MSFLPDEIWRRISEIGIGMSDLSYKDLCCISMSCTLLNRLSNEDSLWSTLLSRDFPSNDPSSSQQLSKSPSKTLYKIRFERDTARKLAAHRRAVLRIESRVAEYSKRLQDLQLQSVNETQRMKATSAELSNLEKVRQASVALNVWQPDIVRGRQKQIVEQCAVPVDTRIATLKMELALCKQQIAVFDKAYQEQKRRLDAMKEHLASIKYHPLRDCQLIRTAVDDCSMKRKKLRSCTNFGGEPCKTMKMQE